jgi:hypothetical protein
MSAGCSVLSKPGTTVEQFTDRVEVAEMTRRLLDYVQDDPPHVGDVPVRPSLEASPRRCIEAS